MHPTALNMSSLFFKAYTDDIANGTVLEIGSQIIGDENGGSVREMSPPRFEYIGADFVSGKGVDVILDDPYVLPFDSESVDIILCSSCFEHCEFFWLTFLEMMRVLKGSGLLYLNAPSNGSFHRFPVDCWRFYPDSGRALVRWANRNNYNAVLLESFISRQGGGFGGLWSDFVSVVLKDVQCISKYNGRIIDKYTDFINGFRAESDDIVNLQELSEDQQIRLVANQILTGKVKLK